MDAVRALVSGRRHRFRDGIFDLDLAYITPRVIAMSLPAEGAESAWRNPLPEVERFLKGRHGGNFMIFNLCAERKYDYSRFDYRVVEMGWPDHYTAPLPVLLELGAAIDAWLAGGEERVAVVHCLAGKGRTGVAVACYLVMSGLVLQPGGLDKVEDGDSGADGSGSSSSAGAAEKQPPKRASSGSILQQSSKATPDMDSDSDTDNGAADNEGSGNEQEDAEENVEEEEEVQREEEEAETPKPSAETAAAPTPLSPLEAEAAVAAAGSANPVSSSPSSLSSETALGVAALIMARFNAFDRAVPPAHEIAHRAIKHFSTVRGDGLNFAAQRRSVLYMALLVRATVVDALAASDAPAPPPPADHSSHSSRISASAVAGASSLSPPPLPTGPVIDYSPAFAAMRNVTLPRPPTITVWTVVLHGVPLMRSSRDLRPSLQLRTQPHQDATVETVFDTLYSVASPDDLPVYTSVDDAIIFNVNASLVGDVLLRLLHHYKQRTATGGLVWRSKEVFRYSFNTSMMRERQRHGNTIHRVFRADVDVHKRKVNSKRIPREFYFDLLYDEKKGSGAGAVSASPVEGILVAASSVSGPVAAGSGGGGNSGCEAEGASSSSSSSAPSPPPLSPSPHFEMEQKVLASQLLNEEGGYSV